MTINKTRPSLKIELIRKKSLIGFVEPNNLQKEDFELTWTDSLYKFPVASFKSKNPDVNQLFLSYSNSDIMRIYLNEHNKNTSHLVFQGEYKAKRIRFDRNEKDEQELTLDISAIHSAYLLSMFQIEGSHKFRDIKFEEFIKWLFNLTSLPCEVQISSKIGKSLLNGIITRTNAFRTLKEVCMIKHATITFESNNSIVIEHNEEKRSRLDYQDVVTLDQNSIASLEENKEI